MSKLLHRARFWLDHRWAPPHMSEYLDAELSARGRRRVEGHVAECAYCRRLLAGLRAVLGGLHGLTAPSGAADPAQVAAAVRLRLGDGPR